MRWSSIGVVLLLAGCLQAADDDADAAAPADLGELVVVRDVRLTQATPGVGVPCTEMDTGFEPGVEVSDAGVIYVTAATISCIRDQGPRSSHIWVSHDDGATFERIQWIAPDTGVANLPYGAEGDLGIDAAGTVYFTDMTLVGSTVSRSRDGGQTWELAALSPFIQPIGDRPWIVGGSADFVAASWDLTLRPNGQIINVATSTDGGDSWPVQATAQPCAGFPGFAGGYQNGHPAVGAGDRVAYSAVCGRGIAVYDLVGSELALRVVYEAADDAPDLPRDFAPMAIDAADNEYVAWSEVIDGTTTVRWAMRLAGETDYGPPRDIPFDGIAMMPWIDARGPGDVGIGWYGAAGHAGAPDMAPADATWHAYGMRLVAPGSAAERAWIGSVPEPAATGPVCQAGACADGADNGLIDYFEVEVIPDGLDIASTRVSGPLLLDAVWTRMHASELLTGLSDE